MPKYKLRKYFISVSCLTVAGGIGGVHRDVNESMDVSADLLELSRNPVLVVSAGVKSILDIGRTLEYLVNHMKF